jgi:hypothetical protein
MIRKALQSDNAGMADMCSLQKYLWQPLISLGTHAREANGGGGDHKLCFITLDYVESS